MAPPPLPPTAPRAADTRILEAREAALPLFAAAAPPQPSTNPLTPRALFPRQNNGNGIIPIPTVYQGINAGPAPGAVVGIVLGSVVGFLFLIWLFWVLSNGNSFIRANRDEEENVVVSRRRSRSRSPQRPKRARRSEMQTKPRSPRRDRVYRSERITRDFPPPQREASRSRVRESVIVDEPPMRERRVDGDDIVEVIEEHSSTGAPPRRKSRRGSGYRSVVPPEAAPPMPGGYRPIDPNLYAGGGYAQRPVR